MSHSQQCCLKIARAVIRRHLIKASPVVPANVVTQSTQGHSPRHIHWKVEMQIPTLFRRFSLIFLVFICKLPIIHTV